jgi:ATP-dependent DNA ligase
MRSLTELQGQAAELGLPTTGSREDLMDSLRNALGGFDPELQIDPMKAKDSKRDVEKLGLTAALAKLTRTGTWIMEPKLDGARMRVFLGATGNTMNTGRRSDKTYAYIQRQDNFPHIRDAVVPALAGTILDGEVMAPSGQITTATGKVTNSMLNATVALTNCNPTDSVATQARWGKVTFHAFDILAFKGTDVTHLPLHARRELLESALRDIIAEVAGAYTWLKLVEQVEAREAYLAECLAAGYEGVMVKRTDGPYQAGKRSSAWIKCKPMSTFDAFVSGFVPGEGRNAGKVGAVKMSVLDDLGLPVEVCQHGALTDEMRDALTDPATGGLDTRQWLGTVMELKGQGVTKDHRVRHPHLVRLRPDKSKDECRLDQMEALPRV